jgi:hypothetical protein
LHLGNYQQIQGAADSCPDYDTPRNPVFEQIVFVFQKQEVENNVHYQKYIKPGTKKSVAACVHLHQPVEKRNVSNHERNKPGCVGQGRQAGKNPPLLAPDGIHLVQPYQGKAKCVKHPDPFTFFCSYAFS